MLLLLLRQLCRGDQSSFDFLFFPVAHSNIAIAGLCWYLFSTVSQSSSTYDPKFVLFFPKQKFVYYKSSRCMRNNSWGNFAEVINYNVVSSFSLLPIVNLLSLIYNSIVSFNIVIPEQI